MFLLENDKYINNNPQIEICKRNIKSDYVEYMNISRFALQLGLSHEQYSTDDEVMLCQQTPDGH